MTASTVDAACARHPDQPALGTCQRCGDYLCQQCETADGQCARCDQHRAAASTTLPDGWKGFQIFAWVLWVMALLSYASYWITAFAMLNAGPVGKPDADTGMIGGMLAVVSVVFVGFAAGLLYRLPGWLGRRKKVRRDFTGGLFALCAWGVAMWFVHSVGVYGLVLFIMDGNLWWMIAFMLPAMALTGWWRPRWKPWIAAAS